MTVASVGTATKTNVDDLRLDTPPATPTALSKSAHDLIAEIRTIQQQLSLLSNLAPAEQVNGLLTRLVELCIAPYDAIFTNYFFSIAGVDAMCNELRALCAAAEGELERYWTNRMLSLEADARKSSLDVRPTLN
jgi:nicotianamine synthase